MLTDAGVPLKIKMPTEAIVSKFEELTTLLACTLELKKVLEKTQSEAHHVLTTHHSNARNTTMMDEDGQEVFSRSLRYRLLPVSLTDVGIGIKRPGAHMPREPKRSRN
jgi:hypothetical protein